MRTLAFATATICALVLSACATPMKKGSHCVVESGYLADQQTYSWHTDPALTLHDETDYISPTIVAVLRDAVGAELQRKGFVYADPLTTTKPVDLQIAINLRTRRELQNINVHDVACRGPYCWERIDMGSNVRMNVRTIGFLSADAYYQDKPIWRGWVERPLYPADRDNAESVISEAIPALFESFPP